MKSVFSAAAIVTLLAGAVPASAQMIDTTAKSGAYGDLTYTFGHTTGGSSDNDNSALGGRAGYRFNRFLGVEGEANFGINGDSGSFTPAGGTAAANYDSHLQYQVAGYGVGYLPLSPRLDLLARVGYGTSRYKIDPSGLTGIGFHEESWNYGGGAQYLFNGKDGVRAEYTRESLDNNSAPAFTPLAGRDVDNWSVSYVHQF